ncbi:hypothetical protein Pla123a_01490 [Posidoniimonas polymericola]|uniref:PEP-CTERM protein-sorting domain-containing protein n=1 Tax=Posidoniimonas polymericola TaxID=2528002 RepID=A0A5C5ZDD7_9BACT|nr:PEP-CTERM sorting domain-containing protein [Posidoniimonas polymericola]TWT85342.1 hypothetical protein Pla123a_01490 [Posidoniimonas polymericola]
MSPRKLALFSLAALLLAGSPLAAFELPWWVDSVTVTQPGTGGIGSVRLDGVWWDTAAPDAISHSVVDGALHLSLSAPGLAGAGDALTPWTLTEEFGPLDPIVNEITGSVWNVLPNDRGVRELVSGPDFLGWIYPRPRGEFHGLGSLGDPAYVSAAFDVSADGRVVTGHNELAPNAAGFITHEAFAWSPSTGMVSIGLLPGGSPGGSTGRGVSADGNYIVGDSSIRRDVFQSQEAFRWSLGGGMQPLGTIHGVSSTGQAHATSRNGRVVVGVNEFYPPTRPPEGSGLPPNYFRRAFRYTDDSGMQDLGLLKEYGEYSTSEAVDVSASGEVIVGNAHRLQNPLAFEPFHPDQAQPFLWTREVGMVGLGNPPLPFASLVPVPQETTANAVSADGKVVVGVDRVLWGPEVDARTPYMLEQAVMWTEDLGWKYIPPFRLPPGPEFIGSEAVDVSAEQGRVVGHAFLLSTDATTTVDPALLDGDIDAFGRLQAPFLWDRQHGMRPLARVLAGDYGLEMEGWRLLEVGAISDDGTTIVGTGINPDGQQEAWRAVLHRSVRTGDADFDGDVDRQDVAALTANLGMNAESAEVYWMYGDFDENGAVDQSDMMLLLANYDGRSSGDFNGDGVVDAGDYSFWRDHHGDQTGLADANGDNQADAADYHAWRSNFGLVLGEPVADQTVPEPGALGLLVLAAIVGWRRRKDWPRRGTRRHKKVASVGPTLPGGSCALLCLFVAINYRSRA